MGETLLRVEGLSKTYLHGGRRLEVLRGVDLEIARGELVALTGPSGAGKSTFLHLVGTLDEPTAGRVVFEGRDLFALTVAGATAVGVLAAVAPAVRAARLEPAVAIRHGG